MTYEHERELFVGRRLRQMGFAPGQKLRLYGDRFDLASNPFARGSHYLIEGISERLGTLRHIPIPISLVGLLEKEFSMMEQLRPAA